MIRARTLLICLVVGAAVSAGCFAVSRVLPDRPDIVTRELAWSGDTLILGAPAEVHFTQSAGPAKLIITGPRRSVGQISVRRGVIDDSRMSTGTRLQIALTAPNVTRFDLKGGDKLIIDNFDQKTMTIAMTGAAQVTATGKVGAVTLKVQGASFADLGLIDSESADVDIEGASRAVIAPRRSARLSLENFATVVLTTKPDILETRLRDSARVISLRASTSVKEEK